VRVGSSCGRCGASRSWRPRPRAQLRSSSAKLERGRGGAQDAGSAAILSRCNFQGGTCPSHASESARSQRRRCAAGNQCDQDRIAAMDWQCGASRRGAGCAFLPRKLRALPRARRAKPDRQFSHPDGAGHRGCVDRRLRSHRDGPTAIRSGRRCCAVDGRRSVSTKWDGQEDVPRYAQAMPGQLESSAIDLLDSQLMYIRINPRSFTPSAGSAGSGLRDVNQFLSAHALPASWRRTRWRNMRCG